MARFRHPYLLFFRFIALARITTPSLPPPPPPPPPPLPLPIAHGTSSSVAGTPADYANVPSILVSHGTTATHPPAQPPSVTINLSIGGQVLTQSSILPDPHFTSTASAQVPASPDPPSLPPAAELEHSVDQIRSWADITRKYANDVINKHNPWTWDNKSLTWTPSYVPFTTSSALSTLLVWREFHDGIHGHLSTTELTAGWGSRWKHGQGKAEWTRRNKVTELIRQITATRTNWTYDIALRFLKSEYQEHYKSARKLADDLGRKGSSLKEEMLEKAKEWSVS